MNLFLLNSFRESLKERPVSRTAIREPNNIRASPTHTILGTKWQMVMWKKLSKQKAAVRKLALNKDQHD